MEAVVSADGMTDTLSPRLEGADEPSLVSAAVLKRWLGSVARGAPLTSTQEFTVSRLSIGCSASIAAVLLSVTAAARADCQADIAQLDLLLKNPSLSANGKTDLLEAKKKAIAAVKTDDDATCNKVIVAATKQAGVASTARAPTTPVAARKAAPTLGDLTPFRTSVSATLRLVKLGDMPNAKMSVRNLETAWDDAEPRLRARNADAWKTVDKAIDRALSELRASKPDATSSAQALTDLLAVMDATK